MNVLIGAAVLLVVTSAVALFVGWTTSVESLYWTSIAASAAAGAVLFAAWRLSARARTPGGAAPAADRSSKGAANSAGSTAGTSVGSPTSRIRLRRARSPSPAASPKPESAAPPAGAPKAAALGDKPNGTRSDDVVAIPSRKRFHRPDCRYSRAKGAERTTRAAARRQGFDPCGICKP